MGSHDFYDTYRGDLDAEQAYRELCDEAAYEDGHSAYSGTISTTGGVNVVASRPLRLADAEALAQSRIDNLHKWEACEAIPLAVETPDTWERGGTVDVEAVIPAGLSHEDRQALIAKAAGVGVDEIGGSYSVAQEPVKTVVRTAAPKGATETRFFVSIDGHANLQWDAGYGSQADARRALDGFLHIAGRTRSEATGEVVAMMRRATGEPLVTGRATTKQYRVTYRVTLRRLVKAGTVDTSRRGGWLFYGWAAS